MTYKRKEVIGDCTLYEGDCLEVMPTLGEFDAVVTDVQLGRKFTGIEMEAKYFDIACKRIEEAYKQPRLFEEERPAPPVQEQISFGGEDD